MWIDLIDSEAGGKESRYRVCHATARSEVNEAISTTIDGEVMESARVVQNTIEISFTHEPSVVETM